MEWDTASLSWLMTNSWSSPSLVPFCWPKRRKKYYNIEGKTHCAYTFYAKITRIYKRGENEIYIYSYILIQWYIKNEIVGIASRVPAGIWMTAPNPIASTVSSSCGGRTHSAISNVPRVTQWALHIGWRRIFDHWLHCYRLVWGATWDSHEIS